MEYKSLEASLDLFREIYFKDGNLNEEGFLGNLDYENFDAPNHCDSRKYTQKGKNPNGSSKIIGNSVFSPRIILIDERKGRGPTLKPPEYKYMLTLDSNGRFNNYFLSDMDDDYDANKCNKGIDITGMSEKDIMEKVEELLQMSNEAIMQTFDVQVPPNIKVGLVIDDVVQPFFQSPGIHNLRRRYSTVERFETSADERRVEQYWEECNNEAGRFKAKGKVLINSQDGTPGMCTDEIYYVITSIGKDIRIQIMIKEESLPEEFKRGPYTSVTSKLGQDILTTLTTKFPDKKVISSEEVVKSGIDAGVTTTDVKSVLGALTSQDNVVNNVNPEAPR